MGDLVTLEPEGMNSIESRRTQVGWEEGSVTGAEGGLKTKNKAAPLWHAHSSGISWQRVTVFLGDNYRARSARA